jgi:hypothetical protein
MWALKLKLDDEREHSVGRAIEDAQRRSLQVCAAQGVVPHRVVAAAHDAATRAEIRYRDEMADLEDEDSEPVIVTAPARTFVVEAARRDKSR